MGTMLFVLIGTTAVIVTGGSDLVAIALAHGLAYALMVYLTANISGGHINPAVTLGMIVTRNIKVAPGMIYIVAQGAGAVLATAVLYLALRDGLGEATNFGAHGISDAVDGDGGALLIEIVLTSVLVMVIFATAVSKKGFGHMAPLAIGLAVLVIHLAAVPSTGASVNPARTFGPALVSNSFDSFWVYLLGPAIGGAGGALIYHYGVLKNED